MWNTHFTHHRIRRKGMEDIYDKDTRNLKPQPWHSFEFDHPVRNTICLQLCNILLHEQRSPLENSYVKALQDARKYEKRLYESAVSLFVQCDLGRILILQNREVLMSFAKTQPCILGSRNKFLQTRGTGAQYQVLRLIWLLVTAIQASLSRSFMSKETKLYNLLG